MADLINGASVPSLPPRCGDADANWGGKAIVAGVHVQASPASSSYVWAAGMLSHEGRCRCFS